MKVKLIWELSREQVDGELVEISGRITNTKNLFFGGEEGGTADIIEVQIEPEPNAFYRHILFRDPTVNLWRDHDSEQFCQVWLQVT